METCHGNPAEETARLAKDLNLAFGLNVIGFDVKADEREALEEIARAGKGKYYNAANAAEFRKAVLALHRRIDEVKPAPKPRPGPAEPGIQITKSPISAIILSPITLKGFPQIKDVVITKTGTRGIFDDISLQRTNKPNQPILVQPGTYDIHINIHQSMGNRAIVNGLEVKKGERVRVDTNRFVGAIKVGDPGLEGLKFKEIQVVRAGAKGSFDDISVRSSNRFGEVMLLPANCAFDVYIVPEDGQSVLLEAGVTTKAGEILVLGGGKRD
jgi:hypothetical protein